jgi:hypothetical protein
MKFPSDVSHVTRVFAQPALPQFLLSCNDLFELSLQEISDHGYVSLVTGLSALTKLTHLVIEFEPTLASRPDPITLQPPPVTRAILPAFTAFRFQGFCEYLEDLLARIDAPQLKTFSIEFLHQGPRYRLSPPAKNEGGRPVFIFGGGAERELSRYRGPERALSIPPCIFHPVLYFSKVQAELGWSHTAFETHNG